MKNRSATCGNIAEKVHMRTFLVAPASPTKDWRARNQTNNLSPKWLACAIANLAESHLAESFSIWLKV
jgi:hypothetical protein